MKYLKEIPWSMSCLDVEARLKNHADALIFNLQFEPEPGICLDHSRKFEIFHACHRSKCSGMGIGLRINLMSIAG